MSIRNRKPPTRYEIGIALALVGMSSFAFGCSMLKKQPAAAEQSITVEDQTPMPVTPTSIQISYAKPDDTLQSVIVSTFTGANILRTISDGDNQAAVVRFDGGVPVWKFHANRSLLNPLVKTPYHVTSVEYGKVPPGFTQDAPDAGPPPPLDKGGYYIFAIQRASGATSYQAVRVNTDFSLQAFDAEPRAGTSYKLCCNVNSDFAEPTPENGIVEPDSMPSPPPPDAYQHP